MNRREFVKKGCVGALCFGFSDLVREKFYLAMRGKSGLSGLLSLRNGNRLVRLTLWSNCLVCSN